MLLVPRQLRRTGMTGDVPYYGGRFTPAQANAVAHPRGPGLAAPGTTAGSLQSLEQLHATGVIDDAEYDSMRRRVSP